MTLFEKILAARGLTTRAALMRNFASNYASVKKHDPFLLPDMRSSGPLEKTLRARKNYYGDYDIDGLSATAILLDALVGFKIGALFRIGLLRVTE